MTPLQKYETWLQLVRQQPTIGEAADQWEVDRSTIMWLREVAKQGTLAALAESRPGTRSKEHDLELATPGPISDCLPQLPGRRPADPGADQPGCSSGGHRRSAARPRRHDHRPAGPGLPQRSRPAAGPWVDAPPLAPLRAPPCCQVDGVPAACPLR
jgi:hypothetical protein